MTKIHRVKRPRAGANQAERTPRASDLPGADANVRKNGDRRLTDHAQRLTLLGTLAILAPLDDSLPAIQNPPPGPIAPRDLLFQDHRLTIPSGNRPVSTMGHGPLNR